MYPVNGPEDNNKTVIIKEFRTSTNTWARFYLS